MDLLVEKLSRFALYLAIGIGIVFFSMFLYNILPVMIEHTSQDWNRVLGDIPSTDEDLLKKFTSHPAYIAFYETYPDAREEIYNQYEGNWNLNVGVMNFETGDQLILNMYYDKRDDKVSVNIKCNILDGEDRYRDYLRPNELFVEDFIRNVDCLNMTNEVATETVTPIMNP